MNLDSNLWYIRLYFWTMSRWSNFMGRPGKGYSYDNVNTCQLLRAVLVTFPILMLVYAFLVVAPFVAIFGPPIYFFGIIGGATTLAIFVAIGVGIAIFVLIVCGISSIATYLKRGREKLSYSVEKAFDTSRPGFLPMMTKLVIDWHSKICTRYTIHGGNNA